MLKNGSFTEGWDDLPPAPGFLINQQPKGWILNWVEPNESLFGAGDVAKGVPECVHKLADQLRQTELERVFNRLELDEREQKVIATMSHRLINKILHEPTMCLKQEAAHGNGAAYISTLRQLFALEQVTAKPGQSREEIA